MTLTGLVLLLALAAVAWIAVSMAVSFGLSALVARNRTAYPLLAPLGAPAAQPAAAQSATHAVAHAA